MDNSSSYSVKTYWIDYLPARHYTKTRCTSDQSFPPHCLNFSISNYESEITLVTTTFSVENFLEEIDVKHLHKTFKYHRSRPKT